MFVTILLLFWDYFVTVLKLLHFYVNYHDKTVTGLTEWLGQGKHPLPTRVAKTIIPVIVSLLKEVKTINYFTDLHRFLS